MGRIAVSQAEGHVLAYLGQHGPCTIASLHAAFGHKRSTLTSILDRLESRGLVMRERATHNRRSYLVVPTDEGRQAAALMLAVYQEVERKLRERCGARDIAGFLELSRALDALAVAVDNELVD